MDFDPNAATGERKRSGPRWYSRVAFFVIALLLLFNAIAMFANAEANDEQACYTRAHAAADIWGGNGSNKFGTEQWEWVSSMFYECDREYRPADD
jgi:hypothetical protein